VGFKVTHVTCPVCVALNVLGRRAAAEDNPIPVDNRVPPALTRSDKDRPFSAERVETCGSDRRKTGSVMPPPEATARVEPAERAVDATHTLSVDTTARERQRFPGARCSPRRAARRGS
jgi:hypothetical protein